GAGIAPIIGRGHIDDAAQSEKESVLEFRDRCVSGIEQKVGIRRSDIHRFRNDVLMMQGQPKRAGRDRTERGHDMRSIDCYVIWKLVRLERFPGFEAPVVVTFIHPANSWRT